MKCAENGIEMCMFMINSATTIQYISLERFVHTRSLARSHESEKKGVKLNPRISCAVCVPYT